MATNAQSLLARLGELDTCVLSDALDSLDLPGAVPELRSLSGKASIVGRTVTVDLVPADSPGVVPSTRHLATAAVADSGPGDVIVVAHPGLSCAGWGGLLTKASSLRGVEGTIIDGPARDIDESQELDYTIYARSATPITARGRLVEGSWGEPVTIAGVEVKPGAYVRADSSGVVFIPEDRAEEIIEMATGFFNKEQAMARALDDGDVITSVMGRSYEELAGKGIHS